MVQVIRETYDAVRGSGFLTHDKYPVLCLCAVNPDKRIEELDVFEIKTEPSTIQGENNCHHVACDGILHDTPLPPTPTGQFIYDGASYNDAIVIKEPGNYRREIWYDSNYVTDSRYVGGKAVYDITVLSYISTRAETQLYVRYHYESWWIRNGKLTLRRSYDSLDTWHRFRTPLIEVSNGTTEPAVYLTQLVLDRISGLEPQITKLWGEKSSFGELAVKAAQSVRPLNINTIAFAKDLMNIGDSAKAIVTKYNNLGDLVKTGKLSARDVASDYLSTKYGTRLTIKDTEEIATALDQYDPWHAYQKFGASDTQSVELYGREIVCDTRISGRMRSISDEDLRFCTSVREAAKTLKSNVLRAGYAIDALPTLANLWDLVPYSFAIDWVLPIGDTLQQLEDRNFLQTCHVDRVFTSYKYEGVYQFEHKNGFGIISGPIHFRLYRRSCSKNLPEVPLRVDSPSFDASHIIDASALIFQRL